MTSFQPVFDLGTIASVPARSSWDLKATLYQPSATTNSVSYAAVLGADDIVRFRAWSDDGDTPIISATDAAASAGGTTVTIDTRGVVETTPASVTVRLSATDTDQSVANYRWMIDIQDSSDSDRWQPACRGILQITSAPG